MVGSSHKQHLISSNTKTFYIKITIAIFAHLELIEPASYNAGCKWLWINCWSSCKSILVKPFVKRWQLCLLAIYMYENESLESGVRTYTHAMFAYISSFNFFGDGREKMSPLFAQCYINVHRTCSCNWNCEINFKHWHSKSCHALHLTEDCLLRLIHMHIDICSIIFRNAYIWAYERRVMLADDTLSSIGIINGF